MRAYEEKTHLILRPMLERDLGIVYGIETAAHGYPWSFENLLDSFEGEHSCFVLEDNRVIIGYAIFLVAVGEAHLLNIAIDPIAQGKGYGKKLLLAILEDARAQGAEEMFLEVRPSNTSASRLYQSVGFNRYGLRKNYYPAKQGREDALLMRKLLQ